MNVNDELLRKYIGGQALIHDPDNDCFYRGEIVEIDVSRELIAMRFAWLAKGIGDSEPIRWVKDKLTSYTINYVVLAANNIGPSSTSGGDKLYFSSHIFSKTVTLYPPDGDKLDPKEVEDPQFATVTETSA